jgi:CheY-like chemotaxis protein
VEALHAMHAQRPELVLMDCQMPRLDGYAAVQRWREYEAASGPAQRLTVIALTADAMEEDRRRGRLAGFDDHLAKPFDRSDLRRLLQRWLHADAASGANASIR